MCESNPEPCKHSAKAKHEALAKYFQWRQQSDPSFLYLARQPVLSDPDREGLFCRWCKGFEDVGLTNCINCGRVFVEASE